jgi:RNA polymerase sigma-70 factor (ECF subfamily)
VEAREREESWTLWMRLALGGDAVAYERLLASVAAQLRGSVRARLARFGLRDLVAEDVVQEILLAIHLKRQTWDPREPVAPWISAIARNKLVDALRRRGRREEVAIEDVLDDLPALDDEPGNQRDVAQLLGRLSERHRQIVRGIALEGLAARDVAERLAMTEGAVRVNLHRALKTLAALCREAMPGEAE